MTLIIADFHNKIALLTRFGTGRLDRSKVWSPASLWPKLRQAVDAVERIPSASRGLRRLSCLIS
jgi:hypothetical protein